MKQEPVEFRKAPGPPAKGAALASPPARSSRRAFWGIAAVVLLVLAGWVAAFNLVWDFDTPWHLAGGEWMLSHGRVLGTDPFSVDPEPKWVDVHWLFEVIVAVLHSIGGFELLSVLTAAIACCVMLAFALALRRQVPVPWLIFCGLLTLYVMASRVRVRPESFAMLFMILIVALIDGVRRGQSAKRLWLLAPIMLTWVNMHGLYILGVGLIWAAFAGAAVDRLLRRNLTGEILTHRALAPALAATVICLINPWPIEVVTQPLLLWTRISGQSEYYTYAVSELRPTWDALWLHLDGVALVLLTAGAMAVNFRSLPMGHLLWFLPFVAIGLMARRNVGLIAPVCGYLLAVNGSGVIRAVLGRWPRLAKAGPILAGAMALAALALSAGYATEWIFLHGHDSRRFGAGFQEELHAVRAAKFLRDLPAEGDILCANFGDAGSFIYYASHGLPSPRRLLYMDGRLEVHSLERFIRQHKIYTDLQTVESARKVELPPSVRFIVVRNENASQLSALSHCDRFKLIYIDLAAAVFARNDWVGHGRQEPLPKVNLEDFDKPLRRDGTVEGMRVSPRRWYRLNPAPLNHQLGTTLLALGTINEDVGQSDLRDLLKQRLVVLAIRYLTASKNDGIVSPTVATGMLAQAYQARGLQDDVVRTAAVPADMNFTRALKVYQELDLTDLGRPYMQTYAIQHVVALKLARQIDAGNRAVEELLQHLPPRERVNPPRDYIKVRDAFSGGLDQIQAGLLAQDLSKYDPITQAYTLCGPQYGLIDQAISTLRGAPADPNVRLTLGDMMLAKGLPQEARRDYAGANLPDGRQWELQLRNGLCDWAEGKFYDAAGRLQVSAATGKPLARYYLAVLLEQLGLYDRARQAIENASSDDQQLAALIERVKTRLGLQNRK